MGTDNIVPFGVFDSGAASVEEGGDAGAVEESHVREVDDQFAEFGVDQRGRQGEPELVPDGEVDVTGEAHGCKAASRGGARDADIQRVSPADPWWPTGCR